MTEITLGHLCTDKKNIIIWLKSTSGLCWMLAEGVLEHAVVSGLVILQQSGQGSSFRGLLAPPVFLFVSQIELCSKLLNAM